MEAVVVAAAAAAMMANQKHVQFYNFNGTMHCMDYICTTVEEI